MPIHTNSVCICQHKIHHFTLENSWPVMQNFTQNSQIYIPKIATIFSINALIQIWGSFIQHLVLAVMMMMHAGFASNQLKDLSKLPFFAFIWFPVCSSLCCPKLRHSDIEFGVILRYDKGYHAIFPFHWKIQTKTLPVCFLLHPGMGQVIDHMIDLHHASFFRQMSQTVKSNRKVSEISNAGIFMKK